MRAAVVLSLVSLAVRRGLCEESCPAGVSPDKCRGAARDAVPDTSTTAGASGAVEEQLDLISQEVTELADFIELCKKKIALLENLRTTLGSNHNVSLPPSYRQALQEKMPLLSDLVTDEDRVPVASPDDYLVSKSVIRLPSEASLIKWLPLKNQRAAPQGNSGAASQVPSELLVAISTSGKISIYSPLGEPVLEEFDAGHKSPIQHLAVSPSPEEHFIVTADSGGQIRTHIVKIKPVRLTKEEKQARKLSPEEKISQFLGSQLNTSVTLDKVAQMPARGNGVPKITSLVSASQRGSKYLIAGDNEGKINIFWRNGTFKVSVHATNNPEGIQGLFAQTGSIMFNAGNEFGFVSPDKGDVMRTRCPSIARPIASVIMDITQQTTGYVSEENGTVYMVGLKDKKSCTIQHTFPEGLTGSPMELSGLKGFVLGLERPGGSQSLSMLALNTTSAGKSSSSSVVWRRNVQPLRGWTVHKRHAQGDLLAFLTADGSSIELAELLMASYAAPASDSSAMFSNFKVPVMVMAVVLVLGYQYMKKKNSGGGGGGGGPGPQFNMEDFKGMAAQLGAQRGGAGALGGGLGDDD